MEPSSQDPSPSFQGNNLIEIKTWLDRSSISSPIMRQDELEAHLDEILKFNFSEIKT